MRIELAAAVGLAAALTVAGGMGVSIAQRSEQPLVGVTAVHPVTLPDGSAGCNLTITAKNTGTSNLKISNTSQVRAKPALSPQYGTWSKLWGTNQFVHAGKSWSTVVNANLGCSYVRQYRFVISYGGNEKAFIYPSTGGTKNETVSLGNLYTKFFD
ncbi:MAG: hypothetical protein R2910_01240 [Gemmatimonadales bacterium]